MTNLKEVSRPCGCCSRAVSLVEVLVVASIVLFMLALLAPGLFEAKERARRVQCSSNLRQWGIALQMYRDEHQDFLPMEGSSLNSNRDQQTGLFKRGTWFNELPPYLGMSSYADVEGANLLIREFANGHFWTCPAKDLTDAYKSQSGKNQFHYGMNQVLDGFGSPPHGSPDAPGFPDPEKAQPLPGKRFQKKPHTVFLFDIAPNSPAGSPRDVATEYARDFRGGRVGTFHGDYANFLRLDGSVVGLTTDDLVTDRDLRRGRIIWDNPKAYWGYPAP